MTVDASAFRSLLGRFTTGVTVVTACDENGAQQGMTVSAFCSVSLDPPLVLMCIDRASTMFDLLTTGDKFTVNILASHQEEIARRFATTETDKFSGIGYSIVDDCAVLDDVLAYALCSRTQSIDAGDHVIVLGEVRSSTVSDGEPLLYFRGGYARLGR
jgi:flavin reductase (DIM6/NTAB) family NADH-FMN oxidoreductase RutF